METIFNKNAFKLKSKVVHELKSLDGSIFLTIRLVHFEGGLEQVELIEINRDCLGKFTGETV